MDTPDEQEQLYRIQFLQAFNLTAWDDAKINSILCELYREIRNSNDFCRIFEKSMVDEDVKDLLFKFCYEDDCEIKNDNDDDAACEDKIFIIFTFLFNFKYFDLLHRCLCDFLKKKEIAPVVLDTFLNVFSK